MERPIIYDTKDLHEILKCGKNKAYALMRSKCFPSMRLNAKYIVTSSFHATVFSILFEKQFVTIPHPETGSRVKDLLSELDLKHHICVDLESWNENIVKEKQDYTEVFKKLEGLKKESFGFIENAITLANRGIDSE